ncbi:MAG: P-loop NTPase [Spirochaetales bacterium]|nr:P-loop NTPase [Spirochaetales bacterium]
MQLLPIASGKGGVGKSLLAANLAVALGQGGRSVVCADLDLGASNLHLMLGVPRVKRGVGTFVKGFEGSIRDLVIPTAYDRVSLLPGDAEVPGLANLKARQKRKLLTALKTLDCDYLILDLGAGSGLNVVDFFLQAARGLLVAAPLLTSALGAYLFLKNALFRLLSQLVGKKSEACEYMKGLEKEGRDPRRFDLPSLCKKIKSLDKKAYDAYREKAERFRPRLVLNLLENEKDAAYGERVRRSALEYLDLPLEHVGVIYRDPLQDTALNSRIPIIVYKPDAVLSRAVYRIAEKIYDQPEPADNEGLLPVDADAGFESAAEEARADFKAKLRSIEELMYSGALSEGDLLDIIRQEHMELSNLKKENQLLKNKLSRAVREGFDL